MLSIEINIKDGDHLWTVAKVKICDCHLDLGFQNFQNI